MLGLTKEVSHGKCISYELKWSNWLALCSNKMEEKLNCTLVLDGNREEAFLACRWPAGPEVLLRAGPLLVSVLQTERAACEG